MAYVSLNKIMNYTELAELCEKYDFNVDWCKLCFKSSDADSDREYYFDVNIGFTPSISGECLSFDETAYPYLIRTSLAGSETTEEAMATHVLSMLSYLHDQDKFLKMMDYEDVKDMLTEYSANIKENGLCIYGFTMIGTGDEIRALRDIPEVEYITTGTLRYE